MSALLSLAPVPHALPSWQRDLSLCSHDTLSGAQASTSVLVACIPRSMHEGLVLPMCPRHPT